MEKSNNSRFIGWQGVILAIVVVVAGLPRLAHCQTAGTALLLQQSPVNGGTITPSVGVHHFDLNTDVTLTAIPKPGYQFVYWLGDVSDPTASRTVAYLDAPKIIIAVFERVAYEFLAGKRRATSTPAHRLMPHPADYARGGYSGGGGGRRLDGWTPPPPPITA